jgi:FixJ family two-component response regulator
MNDHSGVVFVIEDDASLRRAIQRMLGSVGLHV